MPRFGRTSTNRLYTCHLDLIKLCKVAIKVMDFSVVCGYRSEEQQDLAFAEGNSTKEWPNSNHNNDPSTGIDLAPYPIDWDNRPKALARFYLLGGVMMTAAFDLGIDIRAGWDWDSDWNIDDQTFDDLGHYELIL